MRIATTVLALLVLTGPIAWAADDESDVTLTVYSGDFAVVKDERRVDIPEAQSTVKLTGVAATIDPTTVQFQSLTDPAGTHIVEQSYDFDTVGSAKLLEKYIDRDIVVVDGAGQRHEGRLLADDKKEDYGDGADHDLILKTADGIAILRRDDLRSIRMANLPEGLLTQPTLVWKLATKKPGQHRARISYQASSISWRADYNVVVNQDDTTADVSGWATLSNHCGTTFKNARLKLMGGDVRWTPPQSQLGYSANLFSGSGGAEEFLPKAKTFFEYHLYTFPERTTLASNQVKQLHLLNAEGVGVKKVYRYRGYTRDYSGSPYLDMKDDDESSNKNVEVVLEMPNTKGNQLGQAMPAGQVRVLKRDEADGSLEFIGDDSIGHTKEGDTLKLVVGDAFDLNGIRKVMNYDGLRAERWYRETVEITLTSAKTEPVKVNVVEKMSRGENWKISESSDEHVKDDAHTMHFTVEVPAKKGDEQGKRVITYTVQYSW